MNRFQEALRTIRPLVSELVMFKTKDRQGNMVTNYQSVDCIEYLVLKELVDKETPMKPILYKNHRSIYKRRYSCTRCGNVCLEKYAQFRANINNHCYDCGQKLDRTDEDE